MNSDIAGQGEAMSINKAASVIGRDGEVRIQYITVNTADRTSCSEGEFLPFTNAHY